MTRAPRIRALVIALVITLGVTCPAIPALPEVRRLAGIGLGYVGSSAGKRESSSGVGVMLGVVTREPLWLVAEMSFLLSGRTPYSFQGQRVNSNMFQVFVGPQLMKESSRLNLFAHALIGYCELGYEDPGINPDSLLAGAFAGSVPGSPMRTHDTMGYAGAAPTLVDMSGVAFAIGGGVDLWLGKRSPIRLIQLDYMPVALRPQPRRYPADVPSRPATAQELRFADQVRGDHRGWTRDFRVSIGYVHQGGKP